MSVLKKILILIIPIFFCAVCFAQRDQIDSLKKIISAAKKEDTILAERMLQLSMSYVYDKPDSGIYYANSALRLSQKLDYQKGEASANGNLGDAYWVLGDYAMSMQYYLQALALCQQMNSPIGVSSMKYYIGNIYKEMSDYKQALQYYFEARKIDEDNPDDLKLMLPDISMDARLMMSDISIAEVYLVGNMLDSALFFAKRGFIKDRELRNDWTYPALVLGNIYAKKSQLDSALYYYRSTFKQTAQNDRIDINNGIATIFRKRNQTDSCLYFAKIAFDTAQLIHYRKGAMRASELLAWVYETINLAEAIRYYKISMSLKDSLYDREKLSRANFLVLAEKQREQELQAAREKFQNRLKFYGFSAVVVFFLLIALFLWRSNRHRQKAYALLQKQAENELQIQKLENEKTKTVLQQQATELEMQALRAQMNPHFIFNSLNSINRFILQNNRAQASEYLIKFSKLVRMILQNSQASLISLESELESLELYLELEALRSNYHFNYKISVPKELDIDILKVPPLIIQPYVENAIWHGLMDKEEKGQLDIEAFEENDYLYIKINDNGIGRKKSATLQRKSATKHKSMGLRITSDRIAMMQNANGTESPVTINDLVNADGSPAGTEVIIKMPLIDN